MVLVPLASKGTTANGPPMQVPAPGCVTHTAPPPTGLSRPELAPRRPVQLIAVLCEYTGRLDLPPPLYIGPL